MGGHLAKKFVEEYYALAFGFSSGAVRDYSNGLKKYISIPVPEFAVKNSSEFVFSLRNEPNFIFDFKTASQNEEVARFLNQKTRSRIIGVPYDPQTPAVKKGVLQKLTNLYDGMIYIKTTTASQNPTYWEMKK